MPHKPASRSIHLSLPALVALVRRARPLRTVSSVREELQLFTALRSAIHPAVTSVLHIVRPRRAPRRGVRFPMNDFAPLLEAQIPRLRRYARALTRDVTRADDLVQSCLVRAIAKQHLWERGTNLRAWLFTILHNQHVNDVRHSVRG